jgi:type III restriction enzyme
MPEAIENPVINSPYAEPAWHFAFSKRGITAETLPGRRVSEFFIPVPRPKRASSKEQLEFEELELRQQRNELINSTRVQVAAWRVAGRPGLTPTTKRLIDYWTGPGREPHQRLFFCQIEAAETAIWLDEVASQVTRRRDRRTGQLSMAEQLDVANQEYNEGLPRVAMKIATGGGKTIVMAMLIAWQALNRVARPADERFCSNFLLVTPGITVRDRLQVLRPNHDESYYTQMDLVPRELRSDLNRATVEIINYHQFLPRSQMGATRLAKQILGSDDKETDAELVRRVCHAFKDLVQLGRRSGGLVVMNDEAHHCYRGNSIEGAKEEAELTGDDREEVKKDRETAMAWFSGLQAVYRVLGTKRIYDLSATPFFLKGSGYGEGKLFPWVVSDFALIDAIESGIVKVPRVPTDDDRISDKAPTFLKLWDAIKLDMPRGKVSKSARVDLTIPPDLEQALNLLYGSYDKTHAVWRERKMDVDPTFIVVCSNTVVSKLVYDWIAGWKQVLPNGKVIHRDGALPLFANVRDGAVLDQPRTLLIDSDALESGEGLTEEFRKLAADEIVEFKHQYRLRTGKQEDEITDAEILREALNTVGKPGRLGERIRCVVSVAMLSEGWDANTVTHILGVRAFRSQLLCEQVIGRGLRRTNYVVNEGGMLEAQYADVYGVPFQFIPTGRARPIVEPPTSTHIVRSVPERSVYEVRYPVITGYQYHIPIEQLEPKYDERAAMSLPPVPTSVDVDPIVGEGAIHRGNWREVRGQTVAFHLAQKVMASDVWGTKEQPVWLFPQLLRLTRIWMEERLHLESGATPQMLLLSAYMAEAADKIRMSFVRQKAISDEVRPSFATGHEVGTTDGTEFVTTRRIVPTLHSHVDHAALPPKGGWEEQMVEALDRSSHVLAWVKNEHLGDDGLGLRIPYIYQGTQRPYIPDFISKVGLANGSEVHLVIEVSGFDWPGKREKDETMHTFWLPAVNNWGVLGRWEHVEFRQDDIAGGFDYALLACLEKLGGPYA